MNRHDDPDLVRREYANEERLLARGSIYGSQPGDAIDTLIATIVAQAPREVLEVGCGPGRLAERLREEHGIRLTALDSSARMVELARARAVDAQLGDVAALPFEDDRFDLVIAAWMLYHVPDLDGGLAEITRVLRPGGRLIAVTNSERHLSELWQAVGMDRYPLPFNAENGAAVLARHFASVEREDLEGPVTFPDGAAMRRYVASSISGGHLRGNVPDRDTPFTATRRNVIFVAIAPA